MHSKTSAPARISLAKIARGLDLLIRVLLDPVVVLSLFGPSIVVFALSHIKGTLAATSSGPVAHHLLALFQEDMLPGIIDYNIQFYTALLVTVFWFARWFNTILIPWAIELSSGGGLEVTNTDIESKASFINRCYLVLGMLVFMYCFKTFLLGGAATPEVLQVYISKRTSFGTLGLPPITTPITKVRVFVGAIGLLMLVLPASGIRRQVK